MHSTGMTTKELFEDLEREIAEYNKIIGGANAAKFKKINFWGRGGNCRVVAVGYRNRHGSTIRFDNDRQHTAAKAHI
ncbi:MAG: hypothetical protein RBT11_19230 [Desulfobacterales bacterium]|jgi:hypothetical protein|nr:hypothetical protein [Desulfobacterales bacterium]